MSLAAEAAGGVVEMLGEAMLCPRCAGRPGRVRVDPEGSHFVVDAREVSLERRPVLAAVLRALARQRLLDDRFLSAAEIFDAAWNGERATASSAVSRVHMAMKRLREVGLGDAVVGSRAGYRLAASVVVARGS
jgi:hypothetical protein